MKKTDKLALTVSAFLLGGAALMTVNTVVSHRTKQYQSDEKNISDNDKDAGYLGQLEYFNKIRRNVHTGLVDVNDVIKAQLAVENFSKNNSRKAQSGNSTQNIGLNWHEDGPQNVGGRVRAILVDKNNHNHIFIGSVSGGLWISDDAGSTWSKYNDQLSNLCVTCITQAANGDIYFGTGEGGTYVNTGDGSSGFIGGGIWKSTDDGATFNVLPATVPSVNSTPSGANAWKCDFTKLASDPTDANRIYAASIAGLYISQDGGNTWVIEKNTRSQNALDVEVGSDGSVFYTAGAACFTSNSGLPTSFTKVGNSLPGGNGISLAIAPQDPNFLYASLSNGGGLTGIYQSTDKGATWTDIGPGGSTLFNPFAEPGATTNTGQGSYDNIIAVYPNNKYKILLGGTTLWSWTSSSSTPGAGQWNNITNYYGFPGYAYYAHPDQHAITFDLTNPNTIYFGNDGGIYKSMDGGTTFAAYNAGLNITQNYSIAFQPMQTNGYGMMGGSQDNGTNYISGSLTPINYATEVNGGDGVDAEMSQLNDNAFYAGSPSSPILRSANAGASFASFYSIRLAALPQTIFVIPTALYENANDLMSHDSLIYVADKNYAIGDTIHTISPRNNNTPFSHIVAGAALLKDSSLKIQDPVQAKFVVGYSGAQGVWMTVRPLDFTTTPYWVQICTKSDNVSCMSFSPDGCHLFVGGDFGQLIRVDSLCGILHSDSFPVHGKDVIDSITGDISSPAHVETTKVLINGGQFITRIAVDPNNGNNIVVTMGNYGSASYIVYSNNALSSSPTFTSVQGNLPLMPVYSALITKDNPKEVIVGTEHGVFATTDITKGNATVWTQENNNQMPNCPVLMIRQQTLPYWWSNVNNSGMIYVGTHGRGMWSCNNYFHPYTTGIAENNSISKTSVSIYPNPMINNGTIAFSTDKAENVVVNMYDLQGRIVKTMNVATYPGENKIPFTTEGFTAGTYLLSITGTTAHLTSRFVVIK